MDDTMKRSPVLFAAVVGLPLVFLSGCINDTGEAGAAPIILPQSAASAIDAATGNRPPLIGGLDSITITENTVALTVVARDPDGGVLDYAWMANAADPIPPFIVTPGQATTRVEFPAAGTYVLKVRVTDDRGANQTGSITVKVDPRNSFTIQGQVKGAGAEPDATTMALHWLPLGREILVRRSDAAGTVTFADLLGEPDDFSIRVAGGATASGTL
jgi:hypothetical protein